MNDNLLTEKELSTLRDTVNTPLDDTIPAAKEAEGLAQKLTGLRFITFAVTLLFTGFYIWICKGHSELMQLQGLALGVIGIATVLIGSRTVTDTLGKK